MQSNNEIKELISSHNIKIIGVGGGGNNTINFIKKTGIEFGPKLQTYALNTDEQALRFSLADHKIPIGKNITQGLGAGSVPQVGAEAARESINEINEILQDTDILFLSAGMGGGTGTGAAPVIAELAKQKQILTFSIVTTPFDFEGGKRMELAMEGLEKLRNYSDVTLVVSNQTVVEVNPNVYVERAFEVPNEIVNTALMVLLQLLSRKSNLSENLDLNQIKALFHEAGIALITFSKFDGTDDVTANYTKAFYDAINSELLQMSVYGAKKLIIEVTIASQYANIKMLNDIPRRVLKTGEYYQDESTVQIKVIPNTISEDTKEVGVAIIATDFEDDKQLDKIMNQSNKEASISIFD